MKFRSENHGSIYLVHPLDDEAVKFLEETAPEGAQFFGRAMVVEPRYVEQVLCAIIDAGGEV